MKLSRHAVTLIAALVVTSYAPSLYAQMKVAVVDLQRALMETEDGLAAKNRLKKLFERRQKTLDAKQEQLKKAQADLEKQKNVLSATALRGKQEELQKQFVELQGTYMEYQRELAAKEAELTQGILERMQGILRRIGQREGYSLIVERSQGGVIWVPSNLDLTDKLIQEYNRENRGGAKNRSKNASKNR